MTFVGVVKTALRTRRFGAWAGVVLLASIGLTLVPQLNLLNYFFSLAIAFPLGLAAAIVAVGAAASPRPPLAATIAVLTLALLPLGVILVAAIFVRNCDVLTGLSFYAMGPLAGALYGGGAGLLAGTALRRPWATAAVVFFWLVTVGWNLAHFYRHPPIFAYNPFVGFFSGAIYDEVIEIGATYRLYRLHTLLETGAFVALAVLWRVRPVRIGALGAVGLVLGADAGMLAHRDDLGFEVTREHIARALGGVYETEHFIIHYPTGSDLEEDIDAIAEDHELRWHQLSKLLGVQPDFRIESFIYTDHEEKRALMGADTTFIAKPWAHEVHLNAFELGAPVLEHELAHVFGAALHGGWLGLPTEAVVLPRMALVEGFAVAAEWSEGRLTPHQWSAAMLELGLAPPMEVIFGAGGFIGTHSGKAYTLAGSFLRWLLDTYGVERYRDLYATGSPEEAYGEPLADLATRWEAFLRDRQAVPLTDDDRRLAEYQFDAPSLFHRVCALESARWERSAAAASARGEVATALELTRRVLGHDPENPGKRLTLVNALVRARRLPEALELGRALAADGRASKVMQLRARLRAADIAWLMGRRAEARDAYRDLATAPFDDATLRSTTVRLLAIGWSDTELGDLVRDYFEDTPADHAAAVEALERLAERAPGNAIVRYLLGKRLMGARRWEDADLAFADALRLGVGPDVLAREAWFQRGVACFRLGEPDVAEAHFRQALRLYTSEGFRVVARDWIERCVFDKTREESRLTD